MEQFATALVFIFVIFLVSLAGAVLPLAIKMNDRQLHLTIAFSAGIFLGVLFLMLFPEAISESVEGGNDTFTIMCAVLAGFLVIFILDFMLKQHSKETCDCEECKDLHAHDITSLSAFIGLSIHACFDGLALAAAFTAGETIGLSVLVALCIHKLIVVFSLSSTFLLSNRRKSALMYLLTFCLITPVTALGSYAFISGVDIGITGIALCFSVGIFLFVTMCDILPEAFHRKAQNNKSVILMLVGLAVVIALVLFTNSLGGHI